MAVVKASVVIDFTLCSFMILFPVILLVSQIRRKFQGRYKHKFDNLTAMDKLLVLSAMFGYGFLSISGIMVTLQGISYYQYGENIESKQFIIFNFGYVIFTTLCLLSNYYFILIRVYSTFQESVYKINKREIAINILATLLSVISGTINGCLIAFNIYDEYYANICYLILFILLWCCFLHAMWAFNSRLFKLCVSHQKSISLSNQLSDEQMRILFVIRKHTILGSVIMIFGVVGILDYVIANYITDEKYRTLSIYLVSEDWIILFDFIFTICVNLSVFCIFLSFTENRERYYYFCKHCDHRCSSFCETMAKRNIDILEAEEEQISDNATEITLSQRE